jgi:hypothetical protein
MWPPESTINSSPLLIVSPLLVTPLETVIVVMVMRSGLSPRSA